MPATPTRWKPSSRPHCLIDSCEVFGLHGLGRAGWVGCQYNDVMQPIPAGVYSAAQVRELDRRAIERCGLPGYELMTRAGHATLNALRQRWPEARSLLGLLRSRQQRR